MTIVTEYLIRRGVPFETLTHPRTYTSASEAAVLDIDPDLVAKPVVLSTGTGYVLTVIPSDRRLDLHGAAAALGVPHARLATEVEIQNTFPGFELGALPPMSSVLHVPVIVDGTLAGHEIVVFADGLQTRSIRMRVEDLLEIETVRVANLIAT